MNLRTLKQNLRPAGYTIASLLASLGGILNGLDNGSIGGITAMPQFADTFGTITPIMRGFTVSLIMLAGVLPSLVTGQLADRYGRLPIITIGALLFLAGVVLQASAFQLSMFLVGRGLAGFGQGLWLGNVSVYICEIAPSAKRGMLVSIPQFLVTIGLCLGYFSCYGTVRLSSSIAWRAPYIIQGVVATTFVIASRYLPPSPRWLVMNNDRPQAMAAIERLGIHREEAEKDILRLSDNEQQQVDTTLIQKLLMPFKRDYRSRTILALFVLGMVQLSGIDGVIYYAPTLFEQAGLPEKTAGFLASGLSSILILAISIPAMIFADRWGRRVSVISGGILISGCMILIGSLYAADQVHQYGIARWVVIVSIFVYALTYSATWAIVGKIVATEVQPAKTRASANCVGMALSFLTNWFVAFTTPIFLAHSSSGPYFLFGALSIGTVVVLAAIQPETRGQPLESIHASFQRPIGRSWAYHMKRLVSRKGPSPVPSSGTPSTATSDDAGVELSSLASGASSIQVQAAAA